MDLCLSLELQQVECTLMDDVNNLYVKVDHGHILIIRGLLSSHCTTLSIPTFYSLA